MSAFISDCGNYRYWLHRRWESFFDDERHATFVMLNPSTADATQDDPTIRRCIGFAKAFGYDGIHVVNLYALRSPSPQALWAADDPVGPDNDQYLKDAARVAAIHGWLLIAAWGTHAKSDRVASVLRLPHFDRLQSFGITNKGAPRHPLYLPASSTLAPWPTREAS